MPDNFLPTTKIPLKAVGFAGRLVTLDAEQTALKAAFLALTDGQQRIVMGNARDGGFITGAMVIDGRLNKVENEKPVQYASFEPDPDLWKGDI